MNFCVYVLNLFGCGYFVSFDCLNWFVRDDDLRFLVGVFFVVDFRRYGFELSENYIYCFFVFLFF